MGLPEYKKTNTLSSKIRDFNIKFNLQGLKTNNKIIYKNYTGTKNLKANI